MKPLMAMPALAFRTLLLCEKTITVDQYKDWLSDYRDAATAMVKREEKMEAVADRLERDFELVGCTAIEDKLQDEVDQAIFAMKKAGVKSLGSHWR